MRGVRKLFLNFWNFKRTCRRTLSRVELDRGNIPHLFPLSPSRFVINSVIGSEAPDIRGEVGRGTAHINKISNLSLSSFPAQTQHPSVVHFISSADGPLRNNQRWWPHSCWMRSWRCWHFWQQTKLRSQKRGELIHTRLKHKAGNPTW